MKLIVCPTDFSTNATHAIHFASKFGSDFGARIVLVHAYETPVLYAETLVQSVQEADELVRDIAEKKLVTLINKLKKQYKNVSYEHQLSIGLPHEQIVNISSKLSADIIVMGATGKGNLERMLMGSTTTRVIRDAHCPVLCIPADSQFKGIKKIVFATDLQEDNLLAATAITGFADKFEADLIFLFVDDKHLLHSDEMVAKMTKRIRLKVKYPRISGYISSDKSITKGIEIFLKKYPADLLVMYTHGKHFPSSMFNQSITKLMSHQSRIPLLAVKHKDRPLLTKV